MAIRTIRLNAYCFVDIDFKAMSVELFVTDDSINVLYFTEIKAIYDRMKKGDIPLDSDVNE